MAWATSVLKHRERRRCRIAGKYRETRLPSDPFVSRDSCTISTNNIFLSKSFIENCGARSVNARFVCKI
jgi:hypothetical protein